ncbi:MAG: hypothetical protein DMG21_06515 [Acidobacteria bacterium]|nr:MAG: hypothetical protein DMG21_06515 [Acidobacteriota bacterium]
MKTGYCCICCDARPDIIGSSAGSVARSAGSTIFWSIAAMACPSATACLAAVASSFCFSASMNFSRSKFWS